MGCPGNGEAGVLGGSFTWGSVMQADVTTEEMSLNGRRQIRKEPEIRSTGSGVGR